MREFGLEASWEIEFNVIDTSAECFTDLDGSGVTDLGDLLQLLAAFGTSSAGDVDGNTTTALSDLLAVLAEFGNECPRETDSSAARGPTGGAACFCSAHWATVRPGAPLERDSI